MCRVDLRIWGRMQEKLHATQITLAIPQRAIAHHQSIQNKFHGAISEELSPVASLVDVVEQ